MSDVSVLSHEYKTASELSSTINRALITLKKASLHLQGAETTPPGQFEQSREVLAQVLESLAFHLKPAGDRTPDVSSTPEIPAALVARVRTEHRGDLVYYLQDLQRLAHLLREQPTDLTRDDLALLDKLAAAADAETSSIFRRLMRI